MILIDVNEPEEYYKALLERGLPIKRHEIGFCDYIVSVEDYNIGVERKTPPDMVQSIIDGRVFNQAYMMSTLFPRSYILVEGLIFEALIMTKFKRRAYIGALVSLGLKVSPHGQRGTVNVIVVETKRDVIEFLELLHRKLEEKDFTRLPVMRVKSKRELDKKGVLITMLEAIPGVGEKRAYKIAEKFNSIKELVEADIMEIARIDGIGYDLAKKIKYYLS